MTGRPSEHTQAVADKIIAALSEGTPLAEVCRGEDMPHPSTVRRWAKKDDALSLAIADAREDGEDRITANVRRTAKGDEGYSTGDVQRDKLIIDTDLKLLAKWNPKRYGDKIHAEHTGPNGGPMQTQAEVKLKADLEGRSLAELTMLFTERLKQ